LRSGTAKMDDTQQTVDSILRNANLFVAAIKFVEDDAAMTSYDCRDNFVTEFAESHLMQVGIDLTPVSDAEFEVHIEGFLGLVDYVDNLPFDVRREYQF